MRSFLSVLVCAALMQSALAADLTDSPNFRQYSELLSSAGQPTAAQLIVAADMGYKRIVYLAFTDNETAIENEDRVVKSAGMEYVHIPVDFDNPTVADFNAFAATMQRDDHTRTLVHCQVNFRASAFSFLYRVIYLDTPMAVAKDDMDGVWSINRVWFEFLRDTLLHHGVPLDCDGCDWGEYDFADH